jgi:carboxypeptidase Taq
MTEKIIELKQRLAEIADLEMANAVLGWDQLTFMPTGGAEARGRQSATLARLAQERGTDEVLGKLIDDLLPLAQELPADSVDAAIIRTAKIDFDRAVRIPPAFIGKFYEHLAGSYQAWAEARPKNDFSIAQPFLEKTLEFSREASGFFPEAEHVADPLIDFPDHGMKVSTLRPLFKELRDELVPIIRTITSQPAADDRCVKQSFPEAQQIAFGSEIVREFGYDFGRGRQDKSAHPFTTRFSINDVRITTRVKENDFTEAFFSTTHESGHAMYEQGIDLSLEGGNLAGGTSSGVHESQSRLWENVVSRGKDFWVYAYPKLQEAFPSQFGNVKMDTFYRAINSVKRSLIRTDADEVTYNLHVMIRFDLEVDMLEGKLDVRHLPEAWNERYHSDLGILPPDDRDGCMQDVHWYGGFIGGAFQGYTLGNVLSALFYEQALKAHPEIPEEIRQGKFSTLHGWMKENIYAHGRKYATTELVQRTTGGELRIDPYIRYLKQKFGELYEI